MLDDKKYSCFFGHIKSYNNVVQGPFHFPVEATSTKDIGPCRYQRDKAILLKSSVLSCGIILATAIQFAMHTRMCVTFYVIVKRSKRFHGDHGGAADDPIMQTKEMKRITYWGLGLNVVLTATKAVLGYAMNSASVLAEVHTHDGFHLNRPSILCLI